MKKYVKCRVCGFIMEDKKVKELCPACGVPKTAFIEYKYPINQKRQDRLNMHIHPICVHFPEAIAVFSVGFTLLSYLTYGSFSTDLITVVRVLTFFFPLTILIACLSGIYDSRIRFKKLSPPYLKIKIYLGILAFISSMFTIIVVQSNFSTFRENGIFIALSLINLVLNAVLGKIGGTLIDSQMPG